MKEQTERLAESAVKMLISMLERNVVDTGAVLDGYEATHSEAELEESRHYQALVVGYESMRATIKRMNRQLNRSLPEAKR